MERKTQWIGAGLVCAAIGLGTSLVAPPARAGENKVEGTVTEVSGSCPDVRFKVGAQVVVTSAGTKFDDGTCPDLKNGRRVEVEGTLRGDNTLLAREVDFD